MKQGRNGERWGNKKQANLTGTRNCRWGNIETRKGRNEKKNPRKRRRKEEKHVRKTGREASRQAGATKEWRKEQEKEANKIRKARVYVLILSIFSLIRYKQAWSNSSNWSNNYGYQLVASCFKKTAGTWLSELWVWQKPKQKKQPKQIGYSVRRCSS